MTRRERGMVRTLVVNADDFGRSAGINAGVAAAFERGIVTSTSLMVRGQAADMAARYARTRPALGVGLHVDLGEWVYRDGAWHQTNTVVDDRDAAAVDAEVKRQLERFRVLVGGEPTHLDSHQHVHRQEPTATVMRCLADGLRVPLRGVSPHVRHCGDFYGQTGRGEPLHEAITVETLTSIIHALPAGVTELTCHPGLGGDAGPYNAERKLEVQALCDPRVRAAVRDAGVRLRSFEGLRPPG